MVLNVKTNFSIHSDLKTLYQKILYQELFINFSVVSAISPIMVGIRHLSDIRSGEYIGVSPLTGKKVKPINNSSVCDHLLHSNYLPSFDNFSIMAQENNKFLLEIKESLLIVRVKPSLNRNISSTSLNRNISSTPL